MGSQKTSGAKKDSRHHDNENKVVGVVTARWNDSVTDALYSGCHNALTESGIQSANIISRSVPGSYELTIGAQWLASHPEVDAVICLGCVIQGETPHFDYICQSVALGIKDVSLKYNKPVIFGVLTTSNNKQAMDRAGGSHGNKGEEAALTAIQLLNFDPPAPENK